MDEIPVITYLSLGSNLGDRKEYLDFALEEIKKLSDTEIVKTSAVHETKAWGKTEQPDFLNMAAAVSTKLSPENLLLALQKIEHKAGRKREEKWGPRTLDIDILLYGDITYHSSILTLPHPHMFERNFVMIPLREILDI